MKRKKVIALLAAATMLFGTVPVLAEEATQSGTNIEVSGSGTVNDVDKSAKFKVTLPTNNALDFIVDPHNLVGLTSGQASDLDLTATGAGAILAADDALAVITNKSNVDVKVNVKLNVETTETGLKLVTDQDAVTTGTEQAMFIGIVPSTQEAYDASTYTTTNQAIVITATDAATATSVDFKLDAADWEVVKQSNGSFKYQYKETADNDNFDATAFKIGGKVNKQADWTGYVDDLSVKAVFNFVEADSTVELASGSGIYGLVSGSATTTQFDPVVAVAPTPVYVGYNTSANWFWFAFDENNYFETDAVPSNATVNGTSVRIANGGGYMTILWSDVEPLYSQGPWVFEFDVDGVRYTATYN